MADPVTFARTGETQTVVGTGQSDMRGRAGRGMLAILRLSALSISTSAVPSDDIATSLLLGDVVSTVVPCSALAPIGAEEGELPRNSYKQTNMP
jgi:hypothetical protein